MKGHALLYAHECGVGRGPGSQAQGTQTPRTAHTDYTVHPHLPPTDKAKRHHSDPLVAWSRYRRHGVRGSKANIDQMGVVARCMSG